MPRSQGVRTVSRRCPYRCPDASPRGCPRSPGLFLQSLLLFTVEDRPNAVKLSKLQARGQDDRRAAKKAFLHLTAYSLPRAAATALPAAVRKSGWPGFPPSSSTPFGVKSSVFPPPAPRPRRPNQGGCRGTHRSRASSPGQLCFPPPPRMSYFLGGSCVPTSELKAAQKASRQLLRPAQTRLPLRRKVTHERAEKPSYTDRFVVHGSGLGLAAGFILLSDV